MLVNVGFDGFAMVRTASIQIVAPDDMRGRATAVNSMGSGFAPIGGVALGAVAQSLGAPFATLIAAVLMAVGPAAHRSPVQADPAVRLIWPGREGRCDAVRRLHPPWIPAVAGVTT